MWNTDMVETLTYKRIRADLAVTAVTAKAAQVDPSAKAAEMEETEANLA
jgi:hypothetical protein